MDYFSSNAFSMLDEDAPLPSKKAAPVKVEPPKKTNTRNHPPATKGAGERQGRGRGDGEGRGRGRGEGRGRGDGRRGGAGAARRGRGGPRDGKREFDRHESGTGRDRNAKKGGAGKYNWGTEGDQGEDRGRNDRRRRNDGPAAETETPATEAPATEEPTSTEEVVEIKVEPVEPVEPPEPEVQTYEEYLVELEAKQVAGDSRKARVVENDDSQWKSAAVVTVKHDDEEDTYVISSESKKKDKRAPQKKTDKLHLDQFKGSNTAPRGRGRGRGGARGGRGERGAPRGKFDLSQSESQFPTLGGN